MLTYKRLMAGYRDAAQKNVLAADHPEVFPGYFSVTADAVDFGRGNSYPALDGHQLTDALLLLGRADTALRNFDYVLTFQKESGQLPFAILPDSAGTQIGPEDARSAVDENGGLYRHWVPGNPLRALPYTTMIQNADVLYRATLDADWLRARLPRVHRSADYLLSMVPDGLAGGAGYYLERLTRIEADGVTQCHVCDALLKLAGLDAAAGLDGVRYADAAKSIRARFQQTFWRADAGACYEYIDPARGPVAGHGLTDVDWSALAFDMLEADDARRLFLRLRETKKLYYGGMPTGIAEEPDTYQAWEFSYPDTMDLAAMGRVWYIEAQARARFCDAEGLIDTLDRVCREGALHGGYWRERYRAGGGYGAQRYCEYPANLIRIVNRFLFGIRFGLDGELTAAPCMPRSFIAEQPTTAVYHRGRMHTVQVTPSGVSIDIVPR